MENFARDLSDERLLSVVQSMDRVAKPLRDRFEGDDDPIVELMNELGLRQDLVLKLMVTGEVLRECVHRGLEIPRANTATPKQDEEGFSPSI